MQRWWTRTGPRAARVLDAVRPHVDLVLVVVVTVAAFAPPLAGRGTLLGWEEPVRDLDVLAVVLVLGHSLPLALRTRSPGWCLLLVSVSASVYQCLGYRQTVASIAVYLALYTVGYRQRRHRVLTAAAWLLGYAALCLTLLRLGSPVPPVELVEFLALPVGCWLAGALAGAGLAQHSWPQSSRDS
ncbi:hypothetical protein [Aquipuribacter hungaricus]|uniref:Rod shape-determining protein MreD n=1 Tax=Aquipuribacter hungaricus TaxID=545624 RepID=A0ABV7WH89_9MICO